ncbi:hypothetical protein E2C01_014316 [Portunus trituberculatus]|uniref:Uncharacterized protein n=1 Tax=Portunus trituberculatus TaxID=210409 RepID=A0A5B7DJN2_PORTR|nr:hypothetical protein [Portunus trituberculatus]
MPLPTSLSQAPQVMAARSSLCLQPSLSLYPRLMTRCIPPQALSQLLRLGPSNPDVSLEV